MTPSRLVASLLLLVVAFLAPSPLPPDYQKTIATLTDTRSLFIWKLGALVQASTPDSKDAVGKSKIEAKAGRELLMTGAFQCPSNVEAQQYFTSGTYQGAPGIEDKDNWATLFQDYMGVPYTSEWETETWNYMFVYPPNSTAGIQDPTHMAMYHWHRYSEYTPAFNGIDEHLLFATPLNGNAVTSKNPYTEWANMKAVVGMAPVWTNRWRSSSTEGGGGPLFGCPSMETSFQLISYRGQDLRSENYHWVLWREVFQDGIIYGSVRWIQVTEECKNDYKLCPPFDPVRLGLFGSSGDPKYSTRLFVKSYASPYLKDYLKKPAVVFEDDRFVAEIRTYTDTRIFVHEYFNRTSLVRKFSGFGYSGYSDQHDEAIV